MATIDVTSFNALAGLWPGTDVTSAIQSALDKAQPGDTVLVPAQGTFFVDAIKSIRPKSGTTLQIDGDLHAIPNGSASYSVVTLDGASDVNIVVNCALMGERRRHTATDGASGYGISILNSSNITVSGRGGIIAECWGDAIYIDKGSKNIKIDGVQPKDNRRQGITVVDVDGLSITNVNIISSGNDMEAQIGGISPGGIPPGAGIVLAPNGSISNVAVHGCKFINNKGPDVLVQASTWSNVWFDSTPKIVGKLINVGVKASDGGMAQFLLPTPTIL